MLYNSIPEAHFCTIWSPVIQNICYIPNFNEIFYSQALNIKTLEVYNCTTCSIVFHTDKVKRPEVVLFKGSCVKGNQQESRKVCNMVVIRLGHGFPSGIYLRVYMYLLTHILEDIWDNFWG